MIHAYLKERLEQLLPTLEWSDSFYSAEDHTGTVYYEGGFPPSLDDTDMRYPSYMVYIRSSNWRLAEQAAQIVYDALHKQREWMVQIDYANENVAGVKTYHVLFIEAMSEPLRIGVDKNVMEYSVNFKVTLREVKN